MLRIFLLLCLLGLPADRAEAASVRGTAILDLDFNEKSGPAVDTAPGGQADNTGRLAPGARRVPSPFPNTPGGRDRKSTRIKSSHW